MPAPRKLRPFAWAGIAAALGAGAYLALVPKGDGPSKQARSGSETAAPAPSEKPTRDSDLADLRQALEAARGDTTPEAVEARQRTLEALAAADGNSAKVSLILAAIEADPTPADKDPLFRKLVDRLPDLWKGQTLRWGLDLIVSETRPKAHLAVVSSLATVARSDRAREMEPEHRQLLLNNFIDNYTRFPPANQAEVVEAVTKLGGADLGRILRGEGLDDESLESQQAYKLARDQAAGQQQALAQLEATQGGQQAGSQAETAAPAPATGAPSHAVGPNAPAAGAGSTAQP